MFNFNKKEFFLIGLIIGLIVVVFLRGGTKYIEVKVPSEKNSFKIENPVADKRIDTVKVPVKVKGEVIYIDSIIEIENPLNKGLLSRYEKALKENDSLKQLKVFKEAIRERKYTEVLEDSIQVITVKSDVIGTLKSQLIHYETKEQVLKIDVRKKTGSFFVGGFSKVPLMENEEVAFGVKLDLVKEKNIISAGFDNQKNVIIGYTLKLF